MAERRRRTFELSLRADWCKSCGICIEICPVGVLEFDERRKPVFKEQEKRCIGCRQCEYHCPDMALEILEKEE